ncbi:hypothetical protein Tco_1304149 [Tanacetum coccineum]
MVRHKTLVLELLVVWFNIKTPPFPLVLSDSENVRDYIAPGLKLMQNSPSREGGNPDMLSGNTSMKFQTMTMSSSFGSSAFALMRCFTFSSGHNQSIPIMTLKLPCPNGIRSMSKIDMAYSNQLNTAYRSPDTVAELNLISVTLDEMPQHYLTDMHEVILFYNGLDVPTRQILDSKGAITTKTDADAKVAIQEMAKYSQKWHNGTSRTRSTETSNELATIQAQLNSLGKEIKKVNEKVYAALVGCELCKGPHCTKDCPLKKEGKTLKEA